MREPIPISANGHAARVDLLLVAGMVDRGSRVLDVGCGDGALLRLLSDTRNGDCRGIELSQAGVNECVAKGLSVIQGDADTDLTEYPDDGFDYVILSQTLQATRNPRRVLENMLRIGRRAIVSFPNFGHWRVRAQVGLFGHMPVTKSLRYKWYDTPNIHLCTIRDFVGLVQETGASIEQGGGARLLGQSRAGRHALVVLEHVWRTGGVFAQAVDHQSGANSVPAA